MPYPPVENALVNHPVQNSANVGICLVLAACTGATLIIATMLLLQMQLRLPLAAADRVQLQLQTLADAADQVLPTETQWSCSSAKCC